MENYFSAGHVIGYLLLIIIGLSIYYQYSKHSRISKLEELGFEQMLGSNESTKRRLQTIAPEHMEDPILPVGIKASYNGLLVFWSVHQRIKDHKITCWCFRKCESNTSEPVENWFIAIHFNNVKKNDVKLIREIIYSCLDGFPEIKLSDHEILAVYPRPLFKFSNTTRLLQVAVNYLKNK